MIDPEEITETSFLKKQQIKEGYWVQESFGNLQVWHHKNQIALLILTPDIKAKVQDVVEKRRQELQEVYEKTGWRPEQ